MREGLEGWENLLKENDSGVLPGQIPKGSYNEEWNSVSHHLNVIVNGSAFGQHFDHAFNAE
ncbi:hypothetical protein SDJN02_04806 [Cucurbita argyrosperma subsp. argyrosperma]|nr:hypothetical protein SDJN02_04806 [Cucurbita argyrosperma subsp. argyrosperma]